VLGHFATEKQEAQWRYLRCMQLDRYRLRSDHFSSIATIFSAGSFVLLATSSGPAAAAAGGDVGSDDSYDDNDQNSGHDDSRVPPIHIYPVLRLYGISSASWIAMKWAL